MRTHPTIRRAIEASLPMDFRWYTGPTVPTVRPREVVIWEDTAESAMKLLIRPRDKIYVLLTLEGTGTVPDSRQVIAGTGLLGGGALTSDVTLSIDPAYIATIGLQVFFQAATPTAPSNPAVWFEDRSASALGVKVHWNMLESSGSWVWNHIWTAN